MRLPGEFLPGFQGYPDSKRARYTSETQQSGEAVKPRSRLRKDGACRLNGAACHWKEPLMQLTGELSKVSLANLLKLVKNGELSGKITLIQAAKTATVYIDRGNVFHAEADTMSGREALLELFLWSSGSFSFMECELNEVPRTLSPQIPDDSTDRLIRDGLAYLDQKRFLDQLRVTGQTVLKPVVPLQALMAAESVRRVFALFDGRRTIQEALGSLSISRREYIYAVSTLLSEGQVVVVESESMGGADEISLPDWVVARLRQDNADISQAIVDMVIWVDRVKCWMYQVDADFSRLTNQLQANPKTALIDNDFYREMSEEESEGEFSGPLFGEMEVSQDTGGRAPAGRGAKDETPLRPPSLEF